MKEEERAFCCAGCRTVWHLLSARGGLEGYREHPVFKQAVASGLISNSELRAEKKAEETKRLVLEVREMWCPSCAEVIEMLLVREAGVYDCKVDYATDLASVEYDPKRIGKEALFNFIEGLGYRPLAIEEALSRKGDKKSALRFFVAAFSALNVMMLSYPIYASYFDFEPEGLASILAWLSFGFSLPVMTYCLYPLLRRFWMSLKTAMWGMETLVVIGVFSSFTLSTYNLIRGSTEVYFDTLTVIVAFVLWGKLIESKAKLTSKEAFYHLARSLPQRVRRDKRFVSLKEVKVGDVIECLAGERIPLDGAVVKGEALVNEAALTGESVPVIKKEGDLIEAGGIIETGRLEIAVSGSESVLNRIVEACKVNLEHKSQYIRTLDPIVRVFVPVILFLACGVYLFTGSFVNVLSVLLISCPCAIGIAAPLVEFKMIRELALSGAILRNRGALFKLPEASVWAFDKTGTITEGDFEVEGLSLLPEGDLQALKSLASLSLHPVAYAIASKITGEALPLTSVLEFQGEGIQAKLNGERLYLGSGDFMRRHNVAIDGDAKSWFSIQNRLYSFKLYDRMKEGAFKSLSSFPRKALLSGDSYPAALEAAQKAGIHEVYAPLKPLAKQNILKEFQDKGEIIVFVGDGLNDAPALSQADIGIAVKSSLGLAQAASDIILTTSSLDVLQTLAEIAHNGKKRIHQNLFWAFFYNLIGLGLALFGWLTPIFAAIAMTLSSLMVILNSLRNLGCRK